MSQRPNWSKNIFLMFSLVVIGTFTYWLQFHHKPKKQKIEENQKKIALLEGKAIHHVKLFRNGETLRFSCLEAKEKRCKTSDQSKWKLESPLQDVADSGNLNAFLNSIIAPNMALY